jgi:hypothetical protein
LKYHNYAGPTPQKGWKIGPNLGASCLYTLDSVDPNAKEMYFYASTAPTCFQVNTYFNVFNSDINQWTGNAWSDDKPTAIGLPNNALNSPLTVDFEGDHQADRIYAGDLYGNMYRVSSIGKGESPGVSLLFGFNPAPTSPEMTPIRGKASEAFEDSSTHWVFYGTGRYETPVDKTTRYQQYFFGLSVCQ